MSDSGSLIWLSTIGRVGGKQKLWFYLKVLLHLNPPYHEFLTRNAIFVANIFISYAKIAVVLNY